MISSRPKTPPSTQGRALETYVRRIYYPFIEQPPQLAPIAGGRVALWTFRGPHDSHDDAQVTLARCQPQVSSGVRSLWVVERAHAHVSWVLSLYRALIDYQVRSHMSQTAGCSADRRNPRLYIADPHRGGPAAAGAGRPAGGGRSAAISDAARRHGRRRRRGHAARGAHGAGAARAAAVSGRCRRRPRTHR